MGLAKLISRSYDFLNNKIINAKVDNPSEDKHIANKIYVDNSLKYTTTKAVSGDTPGNFPWLSNLGNKTFPELFDLIFFKTKKETFVNPTLINDTFNFDSLFFSKNNKALLFENQQIPFNFKYDIGLSDRPLLSAPKIKITYPSDPGNPVYFNASGLNLIDEINGTITPEISTTIEFIANFDIAPEKTDSDGALYRDIGFEVPYDLIESFDLQYSKIVSSPLISPLRTEITTYNETDVLSTFEKGISKLISANTRVLFDFLVDLDKFYFNDKLNLLTVYLYDMSNGNNKLINQYFVSYSDITNGDIITINGVDHLKCFINLGIYDTDTKVVLDFSENIW